MRLKDIAHSRTGDKGNISNISVIPYLEQDYPFLKEFLTTERIKKYFCEICKGKVTRYELDGICALNFVLDKALGGGVTRSLAIDKHGKSLSMALMEMEIPKEMEISNRENKKISIDKDYVQYSPSKKAIRIGSGAGYAGDRVDAAVELMKKVNLDYIIFECLAERTIAIGQQEKKKNPGVGYNSLLEERMTEILPLAKKKKIKVITNMGAANPLAAAKKTRELANSLGCAELKISCVTGDDVTDTLENYYEEIILETGEMLGEYKNSIVSANAYMGAEGIVNALEQGADIIITGRVSDPALTIAPLVFEYGWDVLNNPAQMGQAVLAGHLLECAGQVTGGYYADPGYKEVEALENLGFPYVEVYENGEFIVTKAPETGGCVTVDTCKEQMIYEIHNPKAYMTPDAIADFSNVTFKQIAEDMVLVQNATSHGKPETLKVSVGYQDCFIGNAEISYGGRNCLDRAKLASNIVQKRIEKLGIKLDELRIDCIGYNSLYCSTISDYLNGAQPVNPCEIRLRIAGRSKDRENVKKLVNDVESLYTNGPAGGGGASKSVNEVLSVLSIFIPRENCASRGELV